MLSGQYIREVRLQKPIPVTLPGAEHYQLTQRFLERPEQMLRYLLQD